MLLLPFSAKTGNAQAPPIDILNGQTYMQQTQDMSYMSVYTVPASGVTNIDVLTFNTANSAPPSSGKPTYQKTIGSSSKAVSYSNGYPSPSAIAFGSGRMFNVTNDQFVAFGVTDDNNGSAPAWHFYYYNPPNFSASPARQPFASELGTVGSSQVPTTGGFNYAFLSMGNLAGDGLREAAVLAVNQGSGSNARVSWSLRVLGRDVTKPNTEVNNPGEGAELFFTSPNNSTADYPYTGAATSFVTGDFNGDGKDEIAVLMADMRTIRFFSVDSSSYAVTQLSQTVVLPAPAVRGALVAGRFVDATRVDLLVVGQTGTNSNLIFPYIRSYTAVGTFDPTVMQPSSTPTAIFNGLTTTTFHAQAASIINPANPILKGSAPPAPAIFGPQQLVLEAENNQVVNRFWIGDFFVNKYGFTQKSYTGLGNYCTVGMQVGNFDNLTGNNYNPALEVSFLATTSGCGAPISSSALITNYSIQVPSQLTYAFATDNWLGNRIAVSPSATGSTSDGDALALFWDAADVQGRSYRLGAPEIVTVSQQIQPQIVLSMPPMQADYVIPPDPSMCISGTGTGTKEPCLVNFSFLPPASSAAIKQFSSAFSFSSTQNHSVKSAATTSWGLSVKSTVGVTFSFNDLESNASGSLSDTAQALYNSTVKSTASSTSSFSTKATDNTVKDDLIYYDQRDLTIYYYPILGLTDKQTQDQEYVEFSIPTNLSYYPAVPAGSSDWYQPVQEPGNVLSYPVSFEETEKNFGNPLSLLTKNNSSECRLIETGDTSFSTTWATTKDHSQSVGSSSTFSNDVSVSGSVGVGVSSIDNVDESFSLDLGTSDSLTSLNERTSTLSSTEGVTTTLPVFSNLSDWGYYIVPFIFGEKPPSNVNVWDGPAVNADQQTEGPIFFGYGADALPHRPTGLCNRSTFSDWTITYTAPDVALNHPNRFHYNPSTTGVRYHYANGKYSIPGYSNPAVDPFNTPFYWMKGFFITQQNTQVTADDAASLKGPTLTELPDNQPVQLTARIYNYSVTDTAEGNTIHIRFYGQEVQNDKLIAGTLFEIGETTLAYIPAYKSPAYAVNGVAAPNYRLASVPFTPMGRVNQQLGFWVLTWIEDKNGKLVAEMPGHGMTSVPEHDLTNLNDPKQVPLELYSNNIGFYGAHTPIMVVPSSAGAGLSQSPAATAKRKVDVTVPETAYLEDEVIITGQLTSTEAASDHLNVAYYDGDPARGGTLLEAQRISHIEGNSTFMHSASMQPHTCGVHTIYAQLSASFSPTLTSPGRSMNVVADPVSMTEDMLDTLKGVKSTSDEKYELRRHLERAHRLFQEHRIREGMEALEKVSALANRLSSECDAASARNFAILSNAAITINSCERIEHESAKN